MNQQHRLSPELQEVIAGSKRHLIIDETINEYFPVVFKDGKYKSCQELVLNWNGRWGGENLPDQALVVVPGDEIQLVDVSGAGASLWIFQQTAPLLAWSFNNYQSGGSPWIRVDIRTRVQTVSVHDLIDPDFGQAVFSLKISKMGQEPKSGAPTEGMTGSLTPTRP
ncbi:hypothetical protein HRD49_20190 [Corallococcus exiguus]|uniref:hypothetical protein n=1 Tax=Corallococcus exiguus TaxID=83462 RepID=UPI00155FD610|nr:hypothetical protein [Corallococcus exiguus]NRD64079.1 hypothetical protein [Corallococcus exiguus]